VKKHWMKDTVVFVTDADHGNDAARRCCMRKGVPKWCAGEFG
jgi:hypothetical protein